MTNQFLKEMNKKLHYIGSGMFTPNMSGNSFKIHYDQYTDEKLTEPELEKVLKISQRPGYVLIPINTAMGFSIGYEVAMVTPLGRKHSLRFKEGQLPEDWNFERMSKTFMRPVNRAKALTLGERIENRASKYDY
jgi:hypothetical protein